MLLEPGPGEKVEKYPDILHLRERSKRRPALWVRVRWQDRQTCSTSTPFQNAMRSLISAAAALGSG